MREHSFENVRVLASFLAKHKRKGVIALSLAAIFMIATYYRVPVVELPPFIFT